MVDRLRDQIMTQGFGITLTSEARTKLAAEGFDPTLGARPLRRAIQRLLEDPLSEQILGGNWLPGDVIEAFVADDEIKFRKGKAAAKPRVRASKPSAGTPATKPAPTRRRAAAGGGEAAGPAAGA